MTFDPRDYQVEATEDTLSWIGENEGNPVVDAPTGSGKSVMIGLLLSTCVSRWPGTRIWVLTHSAELVRHNREALRRMSPDIEAGTFCAAHDRRELGPRIVFGSIQSMWRLPLTQAPDLLVIDECHTVSRKTNTMWGALIESLTALSPHLRIVGYSATPYRLGEGYLWDGDDRAFHGCSYKISMRKLIQRELLAPLVTQVTPVQMDLSNVHVRKGEYVVEELERAATDITDAALDTVVSLGADRKTWMLFSPTVDHAFLVRDKLRERGITCETIVADTPQSDREDILDQLRNGELRAVSNVCTLTTGVDVPNIDLIACLRPTKSLALYVQMLGRGSRTSPETGKVDCLVLDFARLIAEHGPVDRARPKRKRKGEGDAPTKCCPECDEEVPAGTRICPHCGYAFPFDDSPKITPVPANLAVLSTQQAPSQWLPVRDVSYHHHQKPGKPPSLRVQYRTGLNFHSEWVCLQHEGFARQKAQSWWRKRSSMPVPRTVQDALANTRHLRTPSEIAIRPSGRFTEITDYRFDDIADGQVRWIA